MRTYFTQPILVDNYPLNFTAAMAPGATDHLKLTATLPVSASGDATLRLIAAGDLTQDVLSDNESAWSADHCADALEVPGVLFSNWRMPDEDHRAKALRVAGFEELLTAAASDGR